MTELVAIRHDNHHYVKQIAVISGKGGTGKTSLVASFAALSRNAVLADCDVDAADLHLLLDPSIVRREPFTGGKDKQVCGMWKMQRAVPIRCNQRRTRQ